MRNKKELWRPSVIGAITRDGGQGEEEKEEKVEGETLKEGEARLHFLLNRLFL